VSYAGSVIQVSIGSGGLLTDSAPSEIPGGNLIRANNIQINSGIIEKSEGSLRWNEVALDSGIIAAIDYWPTPGNQYTVVVTRSGRIYRYTNKYSVVEITPTTNASQIAQSGQPPAQLSITERVWIVQGGKEFLGSGAGNQPAKLFIFTGSSPVQVIYGEDTVRHNLLVPAADWNGNPNTTNRTYPTFGIIYLNRLWVLGNSNMPYMGYVSSDTVGSVSSGPFQYGHEDFSETTFNSAIFNIFPGDGERIKTFFNYKGSLWCLKYPRGLYSLVIPDGAVGTPTSWYWQKVNDDVGTATITATAPVEDDVWIINSVGAIQSLETTQAKGGVLASNVLKMMKIQKYIAQFTSPLGFSERQAFWHEAKNTVYFSFRAKSSLLNNYVLCIDLSEEKPKPTIITKDQPNIFFVRRDVSQVEELLYGSEDGYIYRMNRPNRFVGDNDSNATYVGEFQTPHLILGQSNNFMFNLTAQNDKLFDFVEIEYIPTGLTYLNCDVWVDGDNRETIQFILGKANQLNKFVLGSSRLQGRSTRRQRLPIHGRGRTVSLHFYDNGDARSFKVVGVSIYARIGGVDEKGSVDAGTLNNR
jgi:hypothetical protein